MKKSKLLLSLICVFILFIVTISAMAEEGVETGRNMTNVSTRPYNIMILIDRSGSMNASDPNKLSLSAAKQLVDMLSSTYGDQIMNTSVGVIEFSEESKVISPLVKLDSENTINELKTAIDGIQYVPVKTGGTDSALALRDAMEELMNKSTSDAVSTIVMLTDGRTENVVDGDVTANAKKYAEDTARQLGCEFYIVGLNYNNQIKEQGKSEIQSLANNAQISDGIIEKKDSNGNPTGEMVNYLITDDINEIREFYLLFGAKIFDCSGNWLENHRFEITSTGVLEANVTVFSNEKIESVEVVGPGPTQTLMKEDGETYFVTGDEYYKVMRIINPEVGTWNVNVMSADENYKSFVIRFYGIEAEIQASWDATSVFEDADISTENSGHVELFLTYKGQPYTEQAAIDEINERKFKVTHEGNIEEYRLIYNKDTGSFHGYFPVEKGDYEIAATVASEKMNRTVECTLTIDLEKDGVYKLMEFTDLGTIEVGNQKQKTIDLSEISGIDDIRICDAKSESQETNVISEVSFQDDKLTIAGKKIGTDMISLMVTDTKGKEFPVSGTVVVKFTILWYHVAGGIGAFALLTWLMLALIGSRAYIPGNYELEFQALNNAVTYECTVNNRFKGKKTSFWKIVNDAIMQGEADTSMDEGVKTFLGDVKAQKTELNKKKILLKKGIKKKTKVYRFKADKESEFALGKTYQQCFKNQEMKIQMRFIPLSDYSEEDDGWGVNPNTEKTTSKPKRKILDFYD